jgi:hypothetical protein
MSGLGSNLDPELLQARWVLGGIEPEQFVAIAVSALEQGFDGTALQQVAALSRPTSRDLGTLPERVFAAMGLRPIDKHEAVALLLARGEPSTSPVFPHFDNLPGLRRPLEKTHRMVELKFRRFLQRYG